MTRIIRYSFFFIGIFFIATSCKKAVPDQIKYIPKDAGFVFDLNWKSLSEKASKANINWDSIFRSAAEPTLILRLLKQKKDLMILCIQASIQKGIFSFL